MSEEYGLKTPEYNYDRYTPIPTGKKLEVFYVGAKNDHEPIQPYKSSSPPLSNFHPSSRGGPEFYHLKIAGNDNEPMHYEQPYKTPPPPMNDFHSSPRNGPEFYHLKVADDANDIHDHHPSPAFAINNRVVPMASLGQGPEMYYLRASDDVNGQSPRMNDNYPKPMLNDNIMDYNDHGQGKITMYMLTANDGENRENLPPPSRVQRTASPLIHPMETQRPVSYGKQSPFPTALRHVPINTRYVPLSQSKATQSIQRSINKYRFLGS